MDEGLEKRGSLSRRGSLFTRKSVLEYILEDNRNMVTSSTTMAMKTSSQSWQATEPSGTSSSYEYLSSNRKYKKIFPNRVYTPWYRRYVPHLPHEQRINFQPFDEVQKVDEDIALQYFYGEDGHIMDHLRDRDALEKRKTALQSYRKVKEQEEIDREKERRASLFSPGSMMKGTKRKDQEMGEVFGASNTEKRVYAPIVEFLHKMHLEKKRKFKQVLLKPGSKWEILKNPVITHKLGLMYKRLMQDLIHSHFRRIIRLVVCVMRFIDTIRVISGDTKQILREIEYFKSTQLKESQKLAHLGRKKMFNLPRYFISKELHIPFDIQMTLTKPWFTRKDKEIDAVIEVLQAYKSFVQYPPIFQKRLATLAWYLETGADKYIIRERHIACDFYILLKGKAKVIKLSGDPYIPAGGEIRIVRYIKKSEGFGDESMSDPECDREYSVVSCEPCALLSISVHDYLEMLNTKKDNEIAPEHIIFLSHLKFLDNFPKIKLAEEGSDNITIHYFRPETVVSKNLEESNFVFVVINGTCRMLTELLPDDYHASKRKSRYLVKSESRQKFQKRIQRSSVPTFTTIMDSINEPTNVTRFSVFGKLKHEIEHQKKLLEPMLVANQEAIAELKWKTNQILMTLPAAAQKKITLENMSQLSNKRLTMIMSGSENCLETFKRSASLIQDKLAILSISGSGSLRGSIDLKSQFSRDMEMKDDEKMKIEEQMNGEQMKDEEQIASDKTESLLPAVTIPSVSKTIDSQVSGIRIDKGESLPAVHKFREPQDIDKVEKSSKVSDEKPKMSHSLIKRKHSKCTHQYSRWQHIRSLNRGDYVGHEYLDFNTEPFEPPEDVLSLVSDGCELIMIKKAFLLKYLRREW